MKIEVDRLHSPVGDIFVLATRDGVCAVDFAEIRTQRLQARFDTFELVTRARRSAHARAIERYLGGDLQALDDVPVDAGGTPFERSVWKLLRKIPAGLTRTYGELARKLRKPNAARAVGLANGRNPVAIVVPCHRVIGANGTLTGYASGLERKAWLLRHESAEIAVRRPGRCRRPASQAAP
jgi:O-6-methylguanine DNA methyltransferase